MMIYQVRTDFSVDALQGLFRKIKEKFSFTEDQLKIFASWLRENTGMGEAMSQMHDELRRDGISLTPVFLGSKDDSEDLFLKAMIAAFRVCDGVLGNPESITLIEFPADIHFDDFMRLVEQLHADNS
jgi:hypothetical protein